MNKKEIDAIMMTVVMPLLRRIKDTHGLDYVVGLMDMKNDRGSVRSSLSGPDTVRVLNKVKDSIDSVVQSSRVIPPAGTNPENN